jgi:hypothetical protein
VELYLHYPNTPSWLGAQLKKKMEMSGQLHDPAVLPPRKEPLIPIG